MILNRYGLVYTLFSILNHKNQSDAEYVIAKYLLDNYKDIDSLNIYDVADSCYVSRFTVRRFCQTIGFENFTSMKSQFLKYDDELQKYKMIYDREDFEDLFASEISKTVSIIKSIDDYSIKKISSMIEESEKVVFLTSSIGATAVGQFQQGMLFSDKVIHVISDQFESNSLLNSLGENDLLVVLSGTAKLAQRIVSTYEQFNVKTILMTMNEDATYLTEYDYIYSLKNTIDSNDLSIVHIKYAFMFFLDRLLSNYIIQYTRREKQ